MVPHRGTNWAAPWLTSQIGRDAVLSRSYGRGYLYHSTRVYKPTFPNHRDAFRLLALQFNQTSNIRTLSYTTVRSLNTRLDPNYRALEVITTTRTPPPRISTRLKTTSKQDLSGNPTSGPDPSLISIDSL